MVMLFYVLNIRRGIGSAAYLTEFHENLQW